MVKEPLGLLVNEAEGVDDLEGKEERETVLEAEAQRLKGGVAVPKPADAEGLWEMEAVAQLVGEAEELARLEGLFVAMAELDGEGEVEGEAVPLPEAPPEADAMAEPEMEGDVLQEGEALRLLASESVA